MSHVTLIRPPMIVVRLVQSRSTCPPLGIAYLAAYLQSFGHAVDVIDSVGESIFEMNPVLEGRRIAHGLALDAIVDRVNDSTDFIAVSCMFSVEWPLGYQLIKKLRRRFPDKPIIVGGEHVTATAQWIFKNCPEVDYCVIGEGEAKLASMIDALSAGVALDGIDGVLSKENSIRPVRQGAVDQFMMAHRIKAVDDIPLPAWNLIPLRVYLDNHFGYGVDRGRNMPMLATRGCPYQCTFCSSPQMWSTKWVARDPGKVLDEMETYIREYNAENFSFYDLTAIVRKDWIVDFCQQISKRKMQFTWQLPSGTRSEAIDGEVASLLYNTGCRNLNYAPESGSPNVLKRIKKRVDLKSMQKSMRSCLENGLVIKSNTIIGFPGETHREVWQTIKFLVRIAVLGIHETTISGYIPYPGTEIYDSLRSERLIDDFSDEYFWSLATTSDIKESVSWSKNISNKALARYRVLGLLTFYCVSFMVRPIRIIRPLMNLLLKRKDESRMEASLRALFSKLRPFRKRVTASY